MKAGIADETWQSQVGDWSSQLGAPEECGTASRLAHLIGIVDSEGRGRAVVVECRGLADPFDAKAS